MPEPTVVENELPANIIFAIGNYVQLCARIEKLLIRAILTVEGREGEELRARYSELSLMSTRELISAVKEISDKLPEDHRWSSYFEKLRPYLYRFVDNRHKAVHGIVTHHSQLQVSYFDKKSREFATMPIAPDDVNEMLQHADHITRALLQFCEEPVQDI
ncbi:hypothetical protein [Roseovarius salis]|uniref:hypothetical protein n=1 Tax=Roseovarius salis TaxID=3376063 RepID=UPI0037CBDA18